MERGCARCGRHQPLQRLSRHPAWFCAFVAAPRGAGRLAATFIDQPQLNYGGWINNRLEPATTYYYRVAAVDRWNNEGPLSAPFAATTLRSDQKNMAPLRVECLRAILVSPISPQNFVNLLFRTSCESDVRRYEVYRSTQAGFAAGRLNAHRCGRCGRGGQSLECLWPCADGPPGWGLRSHDVPGQHGAAGDDLLLSRLRG